jgi:hypothetical protein
MGETKESHFVFFAPISTYDLSTLDSLSSPIHKILHLGVGRVKPMGFTRARQAKCKSPVKPRPVRH